MIIQGDIVVPKLFPQNGPSGSSQAYISRALQSLSSTAPNICSSASLIDIGSPVVLPSPPVRRPMASSKSILFVGSYTIVSPSGYYPFGRRIGVPDITTLDAAP